MVTAPPEGWANPKRPAVCDLCGHYRACHYVPGARDQRTCAAFTPTKKGLQACDCRVSQDAIERG